MNGNILLNSTGAIFHPTLPTKNALPFSYTLFPYCGDVPTGSLNYHEELELMYFIRGGAEMLVNDKIYHTGAGDLIVCNSYESHQRIKNEIGMAYLVITVHNEFCKYSSIDITTLHFDELIHDEALNKLILTFIDASNTDAPYKDAALKVSLLNVLLYLYRNYSTPQTAQSPINDPAWKYVYAAIQYVKDNISGKLSVNEVAAHAGLSEYYFMREFKRITGYTLTNYINIVRCEYAKELLSAGQHKIKEVSPLCGFESENYFTKVFKKYTGISPSDFVKSSSVPK